MTYHTENETLSVKEARKVKENLQELGITSPDTSKMYQLKVSDTIFFFKTKAKLESFKKKYAKQLKPATRIDISFFSTN